jgi:methanogenic corrinoid protein MtbC1
MIPPKSGDKRAETGHEGVSPVSDDARRAFREVLPKLLSQVNDKFDVEARVLGRHQPEDLGFLHDAHRHFGDMLRAVYEFDLYGAMLDEFAWYVSALSARGFKEAYFRRMVEAWMIAIHSSIKPPESAELTRPLEYLCRNVHTLFSQPDVEAEPLSPEAQHFLSLLLDKNRAGAAGHALEVASRSDRVEQVFAGLVQPAMNRVGFLWQKNRISVADEHAATEIGRYVLVRLIDDMPRQEHLGIKALVACVPGEEHDIGAQIAGGYLESKGWDVIYVGRSAPADEITKLLDTYRPRVAVFSLNMIARLPAARELFKTIRERYGHTRIVAGGHAAIAAGKVLRNYVDAVAGGLDELHETALRVAGEHA